MNTTPPLAASRPAAVAAAAIFAATAPSLLAYNPAPSPTFLNQALALLGWGLWVLCLGGDWRAAARAAWPLLAALVLVGAAAGLSFGAGWLPSTFALSAAGLLGAACVLGLSGAAAAGFDATRPDRRLADAFFTGWVVAACLASLIAFIQVLAPDLADGRWIARSGTPGRAIGNLRQPNHLSSLLVWGCIALVALAESGRLSARMARALGSLFIAAIVMSASRTGLLSVLVLAAWGLLDTRLSAPSRRSLLASPLVAAAAAALLGLWAHLSATPLHVQARLHEADLSASRFGIWSNTLELIRAHPWTGVGFGEFNAAWTLSAFPGRPTAFFDHTHNLPLHLWVELGLPLGSTVLALLLWALWRSRPRATCPSPAAPRCSWMMVLMIGLHSLLEYPLWYAYFLLPATWAWGHALGSAPPRAGAAPAVHAGWPWRARRWPGLLLVVGALAAALDYARVVAIFEPGPGAAPLAQRVDQGRQSLLFAHHADYAAATSGLAAPDDLAVYRRALHYLLDTRLLTAWALSLDAAGRRDEARQVAARLREFGHPGSQRLFEHCGEASLTAPGCRPPEREQSWRRLMDPSPIEPSP